MLIGMVMIVILYGAINFYIANRLYSNLAKIFAINKSVFSIIYIVSAITIILDLTLAYITKHCDIRFLNKLKIIISNVSDIWMGVFFYFFIFTILSDFVLLLIKLFPNVAVTKVQGTLGILTLALTSVVTIYGLFNASMVKKKTYELKINRLKNDIEVALISDLHIGAMNSEKILEKTISNINSVNPDVVLIAGDIFNGDVNDIRNIDRVIKLLSSISSKYGVYACLGNHDGGGTFDEMKEIIEKSNITLLNDESAIINNELAIVGRVDASPIGKFNDIKRADISNVFSKIPENMPIIVIDHNPINIDKYDSNVDLILSGHTHKGQLFPASIITNILFENDYGYYRKDENSPQSIVTCGVGTWGMPMRVGSNNEVVQIKLRNL